jgi:hypothetical protein
MQVHGENWAPFSAWPCIFSLPTAATADAPSMSTRSQSTQGTTHHRQMSGCNVCNVSVLPLPPSPPPPAQHALTPLAMTVDLLPPAPPAMALEGKVSMLCGLLWSLHANAPSMSTRNQVLRVSCAASRCHIATCAVHLCHHCCHCLLLNMH